MLRCLPKRLLWRRNRREALSVAMALRPLVVVRICLHLLLHGGSVVYLPTVGVVVLILRLPMVRVPRCARCRCRWHVALRGVLRLVAVAAAARVGRLRGVAIVRCEGLRPWIEVVVHGVEWWPAVSVRRCTVVTTDSGLGWVSVGFCDCSVVGNIPFEFDKHGGQTGLALQRARLSLWYVGGVKVQAGSTT